MHSVFGKQTAPLASMSNIGMPAAIVLAGLLVLAACGADEQAPAGTGGTAGGGAAGTGGTGTGGDGEGGAATTELTTSVTQYGITWTFDEAQQVGQFATGDTFVVTPGSGVTVSSVTPAGDPGRHGSMINPITGAGQGYDDRLNDYDAALAIAFPHDCSGGDSLVTAVSLEGADYDCNDGAGVTDLRGVCIGAGHASIKTAAVLTFVDQAPPASAFRPPFVGDDKPLYTTDQIRTDLLTELVAPASLPDIAYYERGLERPWLTHLTGWTCRQMHPVQNMLNYHREIGNFLSNASLVLLTDAPDKDLLLRRYAQIGLDQYHMSLLGPGDSAFNKWPVLFTGLVLDEPEIRDVFVDDRSQTLARGDDKFYFWEDHQSTLESAIVPAGETWTGATVFFRKQSGNTEHEHLHPSEWAGVDNGGGLKQESYRHCCDSIPHIGMALAGMLMSAQTEWDNPALFAYADRWMTEPFDTEFLPIVQAEAGDVSSAAQSPGSEFIGDMWSDYR
ncbi:MAG: hypothetical protein JRI68_22880 [Deltaproteobacteria bacterium]|nr:hypothetical protein [Deltaproteobacteria bacterium]